MMLIQVRPDEDARVSDCTTAALSASACVGRDISRCWTVQAAASTVMVANSQCFVVRFIREHYASVTASFRVEMMRLTLSYTANGPSCNIHTYISFISDTWSV